MGEFERELKAFRSLEEERGDFYDKIGIGLSYQSELNPVELNIKDKDTFISYLKGLEEELGDEELLNEIAESLRNQLIYNYDLNNPEEEVLNLLSSLKEIVREYERIGSDLGVFLLKEFIEPLEKKYLKEYVEAKRVGLLKSRYPGDVGKIFPNPESGDRNYKKGWQKILDVVDKIKNNPDAEDLFLTVIKNIREELVHAKREINESNISPIKKGYLLDIINDVSSIMEEESISFSLDEIREKVEDLASEEPGSWKIGTLLNNFRERNTKELKKRGIELEIGNGDEMLINIEDRENFISYLRGLKKEELTEGESELLDEIADSLRYQLIHHYSLHEPDDRAINFITSLEKMTEEYRRLEKEEANLLKEFIEPLENRYLREYVELYRNGILKGYFIDEHPEDWHLHLKDNDYKVRWDNILEIIKEIKEKPNTEEFIKSVIEKIRRILEEIKEKDIEKEYIKVVEGVYNSLT